MTFNWLIAVPAAMVFLGLGAVLYYGAAVVTPEHRTKCFSAGGDRLIETRDGYTCWRENGTRVWYK